MDSDIIGHCWHCGAELTQADYGRENLCLRCSRPTRACRNCRLYQPGRPNDCREPFAEPVADKTRANFCEHFEPALEPLATDTTAQTDTAALRARAEALFK
jgi:hypothetical protein